MLFSSLALPFRVNVGGSDVGKVAAMFVCGGDVPHCEGSFIKMVLVSAWTEENGAATAPGDLLKVGDWWELLVVFRTDVR